MRKQDTLNQWRNMIVQAVNEHSALVAVAEAAENYLHGASNVDALGDVLQKKLEQLAALRGEVIPEKVFKWSTRNKVENRWRTFFYAPGIGFETGNKVYVGRNDWNTEASAIDEQEGHERGQL